MRLTEKLKRVEGRTDKLITGLQELLEKVKQYPFTSLVLVGLVVISVAAMVYLKAHAG